LVWIVPLGAIITGSIVLFAFIYSIGKAITGQPHQSDQQMIENFQSHQQEFEELRAMLLQDKAISIIGEDWTDPPDPIVVGVSKSRISEYRRIFKKINIAGGIRRYADDEGLELIASSQGYVVHGSSKSYVYSSEVPGELSQNLDNMSSANHPLGQGYRRIQGNWYLKFYGD